MSVFISYAHKDEAVALLLSHILKENDVTCLIDQSLRGGEQLDGEIQNMIDSCKVCLIILTESSINSAWVNQEIGYAAGKRKMIWPLAVEKDIKPQGMVEATISYSLFNWLSASESILKLISGLKDAFTKEDTDYVKALGLEHVIHGKVERRHFFLSRIHELLSKNEPVEIYMQAAFSLFAGTSDSGAYDGYSESEIEVAMRQQNALLELIERPKNKLKLMIWPYRKYSNQQLKRRYSRLIEFFTKMKNRDNIEFICAQYEGPNKFIVKDNFSIEGYKKHPTMGYDYTVVKFDQINISESISEFMRIYNESTIKGNSKTAALEEISAALNKLDI